MLRLAAYLAQPIKHAAAGAASLQVPSLLPGDEDGPDPRCVVEADVAAGVRAVRLSEFRGLNIRVLRPKGLDETTRRRLTAWVVSRIGHAYDLAHAWLLAMKLLRLPLGPRSTSATRFICSTLLAQAFVLVGYAIAADQRYVTPGDFASAPAFDVVRP